VKAAKAAGAPAIAAEAGRKGAYRKTKRTEIADLAASCV
jgi:hypothetical protein